MFLLLRIIVIESYRRSNKLFRAGYESSEDFRRPALLRMKYITLQVLVP